MSDSACDQIGLRSRSGTNREDENELPGAEDDPAEAVGEDRTAGEPGNRKQHPGNERIGDESVRGDVRVHHPHPPRRQPFDAGERVEGVELEREGQNSYVARLARAPRTAYRRGDQATIPSS